MKTEQEFLNEYDISQFERPSIAADIAIFSILDGEKADNRKLPKKKLNLLLIKRASYPYKDTWALPGGFCKPNETVYETAKRELFEETNIEHAYLKLEDIFSEKDRDPRGWIMSNAFIALTDANNWSLRAGTDAIEAKWFEVSISKTKEIGMFDGDNVDIEREHDLKLTNGEITLHAKVKEMKHYYNYHETVEYQIVENEGIAFDHAKIIVKIANSLQDKAEHDFRIIFDLMPEYFTLSDLQQVFEIVLRKGLLTANFRRKIADYVLETEMVASGNAHRPAKLFKRNISTFYENL